MSALCRRVLTARQTAVICAGSDQKGGHGSPMRLPLDPPLGLWAWDILAVQAHYLSRYTHYSPPQPLVLQTTNHKGCGLQDYTQPLDLKH